MVISVNFLWNIIKEMKYSVLLKYVISLSWLLFLINLIVVKTWGNVYIYAKIIILFNVQTEFEENLQISYKLYVKTNWKVKHL